MCYVVIACSEKNVFLHNEVVHSPYKQICWKLKQRKYFFTLFSTVCWIYIGFPK